MSLQKIYISLITSFLFFFSCNDGSQTISEEEENGLVQIENPTNKVLLSSEINWEKLNPARGDQSPLAGTIWGDRNGEVATGFLAKFADGFSSPPHIHNATYRSVVIKGSVHNDDPAAATMWMKPGSFWTQPKGESHITAAKGEENIALVEIDKGPYLVKPIEEAFDSGERPVNIDASNLVWLNSKKSNWIASHSEAEINFLWDDGGSKGLFVKLPKTFNGSINTEGTVLHAVVIQGEMNYMLPQDQETNVLDPGSYFGATSKAIHTISNNSENDIIIYVRTNGKIRVE
jgi:quercetin dioxygenase-like cupin family protein